MSGNILDYLEWFEPYKNAEPIKLKTEVNPDDVLKQFGWLTDNSNTQNKSSKSN